MTAMTNVWDNLSAEICATEEFPAKAKLWVIFLGLYKLTISFADKWLS
jgi:hypothetical protein